MTNRVLCIVESAYRATVEEHDDTALWLSHMLRDSGLDVSVLLRAGAVSYAVAAQETGGLRIGDVAVHPPRLDEDLGALAATGAAIYAVGDDVHERGIAGERLIPAVETIARDDVPALLGRFDRVLHW